MTNSFVVIEPFTGEELMRYKIRLCKNKTEYGLSWSDVCLNIEKYYQTEYSYDTIRKWWKSFKDALDYIEQNSDFLDPSFEKLDKKKQEVYRERVRLSDQRREINSLIRTDARTDELFEMIEKSINNLKPIHFDVHYDSNTISPAKSNVASLILFSDWHKGLFAKNYWNEFNDDIFNHRIQRLINESIDVSLQNGVRSVHVMNLADFVHGIIHITSRLLSTQDVIEQTTSVSEIMANIFEIYSNAFDEVHLYFTIGNHDRVTPNKKESLLEESFAMIIPWYLKTRLINCSNVIFHENTYDVTLIDANICGYTVYGSHGHLDTVKDAVPNWTMMTGVKPDYFALGHIHHHVEDEVHKTEIIVNSSLSGTDSYAKDIRRTSKPAQKVIIFNEKVGRYCTYNIRLDR